MSRHLYFPNTQNARDLGGLPLQQGGSTHMRAFVRTANLGALTQDGLQQMYDYGLRTIIDLRSAEELVMTPSAIPKGSPLTVHHKPFLGPSVNEWHRREVDSGDARGYVGMLDKFQPEVLQIMQAMADVQQGGVLFHCYAGKDRTGVTSMLLLSLAGVADEVIADDYALSENGLQAMREHDYARAQDDERRAAVLHDYRCPPEAMLRALSHLHQTYGGAAAYLSTIGLSENSITNLRTRLTS